jgi:hypothetical protein
MNALKRLFQEFVFVGLLRAYLLAVTSLGIPSMASAATISEQEAHDIGVNA